MKQLLLAATLALSLATPASAAVQTADRIVAVINNGVITLSELQQREAEITASLKRQNVALPPASVLSRQVLDLMVNEQLQLQYAASNGLRVSESEIDQTLQRLAAQNKTDLQGLYARLQQDGLSLEQFRKSLRKDLLLDRIKEREIVGRVNVTDSEVEQVLKSTQGLSNAEYRLAMIQLNIPERADAAQIENCASGCRKHSRRSVTASRSPKWPPATPKPPPRSAAATWAGKAPARCRRTSSSCWTA